MKVTNFQPVPFEQILDEKYGKIGSPDRNNYEEESKAFRIGVFIKQARIAASLTQEELALRIGTKKSYISRLERGLCDIQLNTLIRIIEKGLGKKLEISIY